jgi:hypothetical protein
MVFPAALEIRGKFRTDGYLILCMKVPLQVHMRNCEKSLWQALANGIYKLLQKWAPGECLLVPPRPFCMPVRTISKRAM